MVTTADIRRGIALLASDKTSTTMSGEKVLRVTMIREPTEIIMG